MKLPMLGWAPDLSPDTPGILLDSDQVLPTERGIRSGTYFQSVALGTLSNAVGTFGRLSVAMCNGFLVVGDRVTGAVYTWAGGTRNDITGAAVAGSTPWAITNVGNVILATNQSNNILAATSASSALAAVSGAPKASLLITAGEPNASFVMAFDYDDGTRYTDGIAWSALANYASWTPDIATQAGNIRLTDVGGGFTNAIPYRDGVVAFKQHSMHLGTYEGGAAVWSWSTLSRDIGCPWRGAAVVAEDVLYFASDNGLWMFDGSYPRRMPGGTQRWWRKNVGSSSDVKLHYLHADGVVLMSYLDLVPITLPRNFIAYNIRSQLWTRYGLLTDGTSNVRELTEDGSLAVIDKNPTDIVQMVLPVAGSNIAKTDATYTLNAFGANYGMVTMRGLRPNFALGPASNFASWTSCTVYSDEALRGAVGLTSAGSGSLTPQNSTAFVFREPGYFDGMISARYLMPKITVPKLANSAWEVVGHEVDVFADGEE